MSEHAWLAVSALNMVLCFVSLYFYGWDSHDPAALASGLACGLAALYCKP